MIKEKVVALFLLACAVYCLFRAAAPAAAQEPFYKGKSIRIMVGFTPGGFYDPLGTTLCSVYAEIYPGQPGDDRSEYAGAGSLVAANHVYNVAKPDGLTLVMTHYNFYLDQLVGRKEVQFDARKFGWIGSPASETIVMYMRTDTPYKTVHDLVKAKEPVKCGSSGTANGDYILSKLLEEAIGAKIDTVLGYPGGSEIDLAVEKEKSFAAPITSPHILGANRSIPGTRKTSTGISCRQARSAIRE